MDAEKAYVYLFWVSPINILKTGGLLCEITRIGIAFVLGFWIYRLTCLTP